MGPPLTRSRTHSNDSRAAAPITTEIPAFTRRITGSLANLSDDATVRGRDAKELRDATAQAITEVWNDTRTATATLARQVNEGNSSLLTGLNQSFSAVGQRINSIPMPGWADS
ncbi:hypothetical protein ANCCAN_13002 [Ancylostoma caninum]|uniref:Uncharacterized protein n=1 Tax=Ancylostoma caninum TaxID=29170 RepID=A0A368G9I4_ANCCA|nr:hypothetical protein ANCCAN_13002 [Ancylostoma caninum]